MNEALFPRLAGFSLRPQGEGPPTGTARDGARDGTPVPVSDRGEGPPEGRPVPRFSDRMPLVRWGLILLVPALALILLGVFAPLSLGIRLLLEGVGAIAWVSGFLLLLALARSDRET